MSTPDLTHACDKSFSERRYVKSHVESYLSAVCGRRMANKKRIACLDLGPIAKRSCCTFTNLQKSKCFHPGAVVHLSFYGAKLPQLFIVLEPKIKVHCLVSRHLWWHNSPPLRGVEGVHLLPSLIPWSSAFRKFWSELPPFVLRLEPKGD